MARISVGKQEKEHKSLENVENNSSLLSQSARSLTGMSLSSSTGVISWGFGLKSLVCKLKMELTAYGMFLLELQHVLTLMMHGFMAPRV